MLFFRSLLFYFGLATTTCVTVAIMILCFFMPPLKRNRISAIWVRFVLWWLKVTCNIKHTIKGLENIPSTPSIVLGKHQSNWETFAFQAIFPTQAYVMKRELLWMPIFGLGLMMFSPIAIDRSAGREALKKLVSLGKKRLQQGFWVVIFPEGTRIAVGQKGKYHIGGAWLAAQTKTQVVPVAHDAGKCWPKGFIKYPGLIQVSIGRPIETTGLKADEVNKRVEEWIENEMLHLPQ